MQVMEIAGPGRKTLIVGDLRILQHKDGGYLVIVAPSKIGVDQWSRPITTDLRVRDWPEEWPEPKGMNEMWMEGQEADRSLLVSMLGELFKDHFDFVLTLPCGTSNDCPEGFICMDGECIEN